jgi:hypothetical protein
VLSRARRNRLFGYDDDEPQDSLSSKVVGIRRKLRQSEESLRDGMKSPPETAQQNMLPSSGNTWHKMNTMRTRDHHFRAPATLFASLLVALASIANSRIYADVIVLANRTDRTVPLRFVPLSGAPQQLTLPAGDVTPLFLNGKGRVEFASLGGAKRYLLDANCAYYFGRARDGRIDLQRIGLGEDGTALAGRALPGGIGIVTEISVKIAVDEEEPGRRVHWERRLRRRVESASAILEKYCGVRLKVVATGTWNSDNETNDLITSLGEFEREVDASPARLAIGFTSQYTLVRGRQHMAGTRGPLHSHILAREGSPQISEAEKLEFLVHELGHYFGAAHSPERGSVMRPVLGDKQAGRSDYQIRFDPVNALAVAMVGEEIRRRHVRRISDLLPATRGRLKQIYASLAGSLPEDPAAFHYVQLMGSVTAVPAGTAAKQVLQEIVRAAAANQTLPAAANGSTISASRRTGEKLTNYYVGHAARAADSLADDVATRAFLLALAIGFDESHSLVAVPAVAEVVQAVELPSERMGRLTLLGEPTIAGRRDLAERFFASAYLTAALGADAARAAGLSREQVDAQGPSGFSFAKIAADRAGARFAANIVNNHFPLAVVGKSFDVKAFMPSVDGLSEGLSSAQIKSQFGSASDPRFRAVLDEIDKRITALPPYRPSTLRITP